MFVDMKCIYSLLHYLPIYNWRASGANETLTGVTQLKIRDVCLFICLDVRMSFCTLTLAHFSFRSGFDPIPNFT